MYFLVVITVFVCCFEKQRGKKFGGECLSLKRRRGQPRLCLFLGLENDQGCAAKPYISLADCVRALPLESCGVLVFLSLGASFCVNRQIPNLTVHVFPVL